MKKRNKSPKGKSQQGVTELTDQDLQQVQGGMVPTQEEAFKRDKTGDPTPQPK